MANLIPYNLSFSYTAFQQAQGGNYFAGPEVDNDLASIKITTDSLIQRLNAISRTDERLQNAIVTKASLSSEVLLGLPAPRPWVTATAYAVDDTVTTDNNLYICDIAHTSGTFLTDLAAAKWVLLAEFNPDAIVPDNSVSTAKIQNAAVTTAKIGDAQVTTAKLADANVTLEKLATAVALRLLPVGVEDDWPGVLPPTGWLLCHGQAISRTTYAALLAALTATATADLTNSSSTIAAVSADFTALGVIGSIIEGANIPIGATITGVTATTITMSVAATGDASASPIRILPHGQGDGSTTFNVPDARDRVAVGRGNMGGTAVGAVDQALLESNRLGKAGGADDVALTTAQLAQHSHSGASVSAGAHRHLLLANQSSSNVPNAASLLAFEGVGGGDQNYTARAGGIEPTLCLSGENGAHTHTITIGNAGSGAAHTNMQPSRVVNRIIFAGTV